MVPNVDSVDGQAPEPIAAATATSTAASAAASGNKHHAQIMRGVLDMCVLACLCDEPSYGYALLQRLDKAGLPAGSEASIYLVLKRLKKHDLARSELVDSHSGPARKVYHATELGKEVLAEWREDWCSVSSGVEAILGRCGEGK